MTRSRTRPRSSTTCSASSPSPISAATTSPTSRPTRSAIRCLAAASIRTRRRASAKGHAAPAAPSVVSRGLVRSKADKLMLVPSRAGESPVHVGGSGAHGGFVQGATALKGELAERAALSVGSSLAPQVETVAEKRAEARMKGYVGESCPECGNFTRRGSGHAFASAAAAHGGFVAGRNRAEGRACRAQWPRVRLEPRAARSKPSPRSAPKRE